MSEQADFLKNVRSRLNEVQSRASARIDTLNEDARKAFEDLVEKGRESQKDISERFQKVDYRTRVEKLTRKVKEAQGRAVSYVDATSREQAAAVAENLRRFASRLDQIARKQAAATPTGSPA
jgi:hypothetical protein